MQGRGEKWEASNEATVIGTVRKRREIENQKKKREEESMSLKNNKYARRLAAALMTGAMMVSMMGMTAMAEEPAAPTKPVQLITKVLNKDKNLYSPKVNFEFTISPADVTECKTITGADGSSVKVEPGPEGGVLFSVNGETSTTGTIESNPDKGTVTDPTVILGSLSIDTDTSEFSSVGIYRYKIVEIKGNYPGVTYGVGETEEEIDASRTKYLDVHVTTENGELTYIYTIIDDLDNPLAKGDGEFTNSYKKENGSLYDLTVEKKVTGNQALMTDTFNFEIKVQSDTAGEKFKVVVYRNATEGKEVVKAYDITGEISDPVATEIELQNGQWAEIYGLSAGDFYTVTETGAESGELDQYKTTIAATGTVPTIDDSDRSAEGSLDVDTTVTFTNTRNVDTPTGVILNIAPYILMVALAGVLAFFFLRKRHYEM